MVAARQLTGIPKEETTDTEGAREIQREKAAEIGERNRGLKKKKKRMERDTYLDGG